MTWQPMIDELGRAQYGLVARAQLTDGGMTEAAVRAALESGRLERVHRGVYRCAGVPPTWRGRCMAVLLAAGPGACLSHWSAAAVWGLADHRLVGAIEVSVPRRVRVEGAVFHRAGAPPEEVVRRHGLDVTSVERTLADLSGPAGPGALGRLVDEALRRGYTTPVRLLPAPVIGRRGAAGLRTALADRGIGYLPGANDWEARMDREWDRLGLPAAARQYEVWADGHRYVLDRAIVELRIGAEWNGFGYHGMRSRFDYDSRRRGHLARAGWQILDFTSNTPPEEVVATVLEVVAHRSAYC